MFYFPCSGRPYRPPTLVRRRVLLLPRRCYSSDMLVEPLLSILLSDADCLPLGQRDADGRSKGRISSLTSGQAPSEKAAHRAAKLAGRQRSCPYHNPSHEERVNNRQKNDMEGRGKAQDKVGDDGWREEIGCDGFQPKELRVRVKGGKVHVLAKKQSNRDGHSESYVMRRTVQLPSDVNTDKLECEFDTDRGFLTLLAPRVPKADDELTREAQPQKETPTATPTEATTTEPTPVKRKPEVSEDDAHAKRLRTEDTKSDVAEESSTSESHNPAEETSPHPFETDEMKLQAEKPSREEITVEEDTAAEDAAADENPQQEDTEMKETAPAENREVREEQRPAETSPLESMDTDLSTQQSEGDAAPATSQTEEEEAPATQLSPDEVIEVSDPAHPSTMEEASKDAGTSADNASHTSVDSTAKPATSEAHPGSEEKVCLKETPQAPAKAEKPFSLTLHMPDFRPEDIRVTVQQNELIIAGERRFTDTGFVGFEKFQRRVTLPAQVDLATLKCLARDDGTLTVTAS